MTRKGKPKNSLYRDVDTIVYDLWNIAEGLAMVIADSDRWENYDKIHGEDAAVKLIKDRAEEIEDEAKHISSDIVDDVMRLYDTALIAAVAEQRLWDRVTVVHNMTKAYYGSRIPILKKEFTNED